MKKTVWGLMMVVVIVIIAALLAAANVSNYQEQGGARWVIGGSLDVESGGDLDIESGGLFKIAGTSVTASAAELNELDGIGLIGFGTVSLADETTTNATVTGMTATSRVLLTPRDAVGAAADYYATASGDYFIITSTSYPAVWNYMVVGP